MTAWTTFASRMSSTGRPERATSEQSLDNARCPFKNALHPRPLTETHERDLLRMLQVIEIRLDEGDTVELFDLVLDAAACYTLNRSERFWITIDNQLPFTVDRTHPVYVITHLVSPGQEDFTTPPFNLNHSYVRLTDPRAVRTVVGFLSSNTHYVFAFYDTNNDGTPNSGDYGSEINPGAVTTQMAPAGDSFRTLTLSTMNLIP